MTDIEHRRRFGRWALRLLSTILIAGFFLPPGSTILSAAPYLAQLSVFNSESSFVQVSGATQQVSFPSGRALTTTPYTENGVSIAQAEGLNNTVGYFTPVLPGNQIAVSGREDLTILFPGPVGSFGIRLQDGVHLGCIDNASYPDLTYPNCSATTGLKSSFAITLSAAGIPVGSVTIDPLPDTASFVGLMAETAFDRVDIREIGGGVENDFFGAIFTANTLAPAKGPYSVFLPVVGDWPQYPLYVGLFGRWDGTGYIRTDVYQNVGYHLQRYLDTMTDADIIRSNFLDWYDPDPNNWGTSFWYDYYSMSTGEYRGSSASIDPAWKWGDAWVLPYNIQLSSGETLLIDGQAFNVSGPIVGTTTTGKLIQYWQLVNRDKFVMWDAGGAWKEYVNPGDITLRYHAGWSRLLLHEDILRREYYQGNLTSYTVQYITDLTYSTSTPGMLPPARTNTITPPSERLSPSSGLILPANATMNMNRAR